MLASFKPAIRIFWQIIKIQNSKCSPARVSLRSELDFELDMHEWICKAKICTLPCQWKPVSTSCAAWLKKELRCESGFELFASKMCLCPEEFSFRRLRLSHPYASAFATSPVSPPECFRENVLNYSYVICMWLDSSYNEVSIIDV